MAESKRSSSFTDIGYTPQTNEQERMMSAADRVEACLINNKPKRVHLSKIEWKPAKRGWHGILPMHAHAIAHDFVTQGTCTRRCEGVALIEVPDAEVENCGGENRGTRGPFYATLSHTHFCIAHQLIAEGGRRYQDQPDGLRSEQGLTTRRVR